MSLLAVVALVVANAVPLVGVALFGWSVFQIMFLYWAENGVVGLFAFLRILTAAGPSDREAAMPRIPAAMFFTFHYGVFWVVHGVFVFVLFGLGGDEENLTRIPAFALLSLLVSHGISFALNYLRGGEYRSTSPTAEMSKPYGRVMVLHIVIIFSGRLLLEAGSPVWAMALFVALKIALDLRFHVREHTTRPQGRNNPVAPAPWPPPT